MPRHHSPTPPIKIVVQSHLRRHEIQKPMPATFAVMLIDARIHRTTKGLDHEAT